MKGKVRWYNHRKGYGFLTGDDDKDVFIHSSEVPEGTLLKEQDEIEFEVEETEKGLKATDIKLL